MRGTTEFRGERTDQLPAFVLPHMGIAHVPEERCIFTSMTVSENLDLGSLPPHAKIEREKTKKWVFSLFPILKEREKKAKLNDGGEALKAYTKNHPLRIEDIFDFGGSSRWDDYAIERINLQAKQSRHHIELIYIAYLNSGGGTRQATWL